jgi:hypothetical protein
MLLVLICWVKKAAAKKNTAFSLNSRDEVGSEEKAEKRKYMFMFHHRNAGQHNTA